MTTLLLPQLSVSPLSNAIKIRASCLPSASNFLSDLNPPHLRSRSLKLAFSGALALGIALGGLGTADAKVGVNKPEMLPKEFSPVIDVAGFLSASQERQLCQAIADLEKDTGFKLRILAQNYPATPGAAVKDFWQVDDQTIVFVADPTFGNMLHFNVGASVDLDVPRSFWSRVSGKYGNMFYWKEKGEDASIEAAVTAISNCLRDPTGSNNCLEIQLLLADARCSSPTPDVAPARQRQTPLLSLANPRCHNFRSPMLDTAATGPLFCLSLLTRARRNRDLTGSYHKYKALPGIEKKPSG